MSSDRERLTIWDIAVSYQQWAIRSNSQLWIWKTKYLKMQDLDGNWWYSYNNLAVTDATDEEIEDYKLKKWDFLINVRNSREIVWKTCVINAIPNNTIFNHMLVRIWFKENISSVFVNARFNTTFFKKKLDWVKAGTTTIIALYQRDLYWLPIFLPEYKEQQKIAKVLSTIDDKIELNNKINSELEAMAKELYEYWFVQFDFPDEKGKPYKSSGWKMVWNEELKKEIPEWWSVENIKKNSLTELIKPWIDNFNWEKNYLATAEVTNNDINFGAPKITYENRESRANMQPIENSVWFAKMKNSKKVLYFWEYSVDFIENFILSTGFAWLKCKTSKSLEYMWCNINNDYFETLKDRLSNWATQEAINNDAMAFIPLVIPSDFVLEMFHEKTKSIYEQIYLNQLQNRDLAEVRDFLLPMLMDGQVTVR